MTPETKFECLMQNSPTSVDNTVSYNVLTGKQIVQIAREDLEKSGDSLENFAGLRLVIVDESDPEELDYERYLTGDEEFEIALQFLRSDGARFDVKEMTKMTIDIIADDGCEYISQQLLDTFGVVSGLDGKNVYLMQLPFLSGTLELPCYEATGIDMSGHYYQIVWSILQGHEDNPDESDVADWHSPTTVTAR